MQGSTFKWCGKIHESKPWGHNSQCKIRAVIGILAGMNWNKVTFSSLLWVFAVAVSAAWAQPSLVDPIESIEGSLSDPEMEIVEMHWDVINLTSDTLALIVTRNIIQQVTPYNVPYVEGASGAYDRFCWGPICYPIGAMSSGTQENLLVTLLPDATNSSFFADYYPNQTAGVTALEYGFHLASDMSVVAHHTVLLCFDAENCALGLPEENGIELGAIRPQPVQGRASFPYNLGQGKQGQIQIFDAGGRVVKQHDLNSASGFLYLDGEDFSEGIYILSLNSDDGKHVSARFVVQH